MPNCHQLTVEELEAKIAAGYTLVGTPSATMAECLLACGSGPTHETACCPGVQIPDALPITFSGCANGTGTILYSGASDPGVLDIWYGSVTLDCITMEVIVQCSEGVWGIYFPGDATCGPGTPTDTCDPFCVEFVIENLACIEADCPACAFPATLTIQIGCNFTPFTVTYDADATFTPTFTGNVQVEAWGPGGNGGAGSLFEGAGGGGGGAYAKLNTYAVTSGTPYTCTVPTVAGSDTIFVDGSTLVAAYGQTAPDPTGSTGGAGGLVADCVGDVKYAGGNGANPSNTGSVDGGGGGGAAGSSGAGSNGTTTNGGAAGTGGGAGGDGQPDGTGLDGDPGVGPGGGGGGAGAFGGLGGEGGLGANGRIIITRIS